MPTDQPTRLDQVIAMMREISLQTDPHIMREKYWLRVRKLESFDRYVSLSRRGLERPWFRITRDSFWTETINPWRHRDRLPLLTGGILGEIAHSNEAHLLFDPEVSPSDPGAPYVAGFRTLIAVPHFDRGEALNWVLHMRRAADYNAEDLPSLVWESNLFGRATYNLVLARELTEAKAELESELDLVARVQRSLLPEMVPAVPGLTLAAHSRTARRAGGDYHAVFPLADDRTGLLIADASGHSAPATVLMAMLHALAKQCDERDDPGAFLARLDRGLTAAAPRDGGTFITALYAVFDPRTRTLHHARAGHNPARCRAADGRIGVLDDGGEPPLGLGLASQCTAAAGTLQPGDTLLLYTDGVTDVPGPAGERFGAGRLDAALAAPAWSPGAAIDAILAAHAAFAAGIPADDDCTMLVARVD